jgi:uncharacterized NAD(P)/FAD-binding protein YdhS
MDMSRRIAIVGAGFSGTVLATHLLRQHTTSPTLVTLFERTPNMGPGVAYAARDWPYLLNVPAGRLSADSGEPRQFLQFARRTLPQADAEDFLPRQMYGDYLRDILQRAERAAPPQVRLTRVPVAVTRIAQRDGEPAFDIDIATGVRFVADHVVLAVGNPAPPPMPWSRAVQGHPAYHADPWTRPRPLGCDKVAVIIGNGLTMADVALSLSDDLDRPPGIITISRHGLLPLSQSVFTSRAAHPEFDRVLTGATSARGLLTAVRDAASDLAQRGGDWREVITLVRNAAPAIWRRLPDAERRRFLRHVRCHWDVHRHRLPSQMSARLDAIRRIGKLEVNAGRVVELRASGARIQVTWRSRGSALLRSVAADVVVNATGPGHSVSRTVDPLLKSLHDAGYITEDELGLGLRTTPSGACVAADGTESRHLYYLGPMLRAGHWEATAATELRDHAERMARHLSAN